MPKGKAKMSKEDRAAMNAGIERALKLNSTEPQDVKLDEVKYTHAMNLGRYADAGHHTVSVRQTSKGQFEIMCLCDTCVQWVPAELRVMGDKTIRDQPRCSKCRRKMEKKQRDRLLDATGEVPF